MDRVTGVVFERLAGLLFKVACDDGRTIIGKYDVDLALGTEVTAFDMGGGRWGLMVTAAA
ncbi:hypothetical protein [Deinococcus fonticola]|uniref:hypothetical protein n=1 Tax=Deinococcus fonticola TaxID=2528713 RepID=UPI001074F70B|nr:hypothetical protein [Deinococcus fonticola]